MIMALAAAILLASAGQLALKLGMNRVGSIATTDLLSAEVLSRIALSPAGVGFVLYLASAALYIVAISKDELTRVYPLISLSYLITLFLGFLFLGERVTVERVAGVLLVVAGCYLVISS